MASDFWAFFRQHNVPAATSAWIRKGHFAGAAWGWDTAPIPFPDAAQAYGSYAHFGYLKVDPADTSLLWVGTFCLVAGVLRLRFYLYDTVANTWTLKLNLPYVSGPAIWVCDMAFTETGGQHHAFCAVATDGAIGGAGTSPGQGIYESVNYGAFAFVGSGVNPSHHYSGANVNAPMSLTALAARGDTLYAAHNVTEVFAGSTVWVTATSIDGGVTWDETVFDVFSGNRFMLEAFTVLLPIPGTSGMWYVASHSPTGAAFPASEGRVPWTPGAGWAGFGNPTPASGSLAFVFPSEPARGVAFPTQGPGSDQLAYSTDTGVNWTTATTVAGSRFWYRAGRPSEVSLDAAGVTLYAGSSGSYLWWTEDGGETWHSDIVEATADGLSLDMGTFTPPPVPRVNLEVLTFRDSRMFVGHTRFYIKADSDEEAHDNAYGMANALQLLTDGAWTSATGPFTTPADAPSIGSDAIYRNIETVIRLTWITADGVAIGVDVPAPATALFLDDQESMSLLNPDLADAAAAGITYKLATRGGQLAVSFVGATRIMRGFRSTQSIRTLDPGETNPSE